jgi:hypothetical protein
MTEHDLHATESLADRWNVAAHSTPPGSNAPQTYLVRGEALKYLADYAKTNIKAGDIIRINGAPFPDVPAALKELRKLMKPFTPRLNPLGS